MELIRFAQLNHTQQKAVFTQFVNRHHAIGEDRRYTTDLEWAEDHAFYVKNDGTLANKPTYCEPAFMA